MQSVKIERTDLSVLSANQSQRGSKRRANHVHVYRIVDSLASKLRNETKRLLNRSDVAPGQN